MIKVFYRNILPHLAPIGGTFFVTFRLDDALPYKVVKQIKEDAKNKIKQLKKERPPGYKKSIHREEHYTFKKYDKKLDQNPFGACHLKRPEIAAIVINKIKELDGKLYDLHAYCIMPNHVHLLIDTFQQLILPNGEAMEKIPKNYKQLDQIMKQIKGSTARQANIALSREGTFWQKDSYDRFVRNKREWDNILAYILNNPVKAGLVNDWTDWPYSFCKYP